MVEVLAALVGSAFTAVIMGVGNGIKGNTNNAQIVTRLTVAVENVAKRLEELHVDIKADRKETFSRLNAVEHRLTVVEAKMDSSI